MSGATADVVNTSAEARALAQPPLVVLEPLRDLLDELDIGVGPVTAQPLGDGHSNVTYLLRRGEDRAVLRRPPRPPYAPSAHDVLREASIMNATRAVGLPVPRVLAMVDNPTALGVPFVLLEHVVGYAISNTVPMALASPADGQRMGQALVDTLADVHAVDMADPPLSQIGRPTGYLGRQLRRFSRIWQDVATREIADLDHVTAWLQEHQPPEGESTLVHGDYRLGNALFAPESPAQLVAILDWEMATIGDPLADLGYLCATWAEPDDEPNPMLALSAATRGPGFPRRADLRERYAQRTGRSTSGLAWYKILALWKAAIFLEASYRRYRTGTTTDLYFASLSDGIPQLAMAARAMTARACRFG